MESIVLSLKMKTDETFQCEWIAFLEGFLLYLQAGYDPSFAWDQMARLPWCDRLRHLVHREQQEGVLTVWERLSADPAFRSSRFWFLALRNIYLAGGGLSPVVDAFAIAGKKERERRVKRFGETLPTKMNICLILFFLPPIFLFLFHPLLSEIISIF